MTQDASRQPATIDAAPGWFVHLGAPLVISVALHVVLLFLLALGSWRALAPSSRDAEYAVSIAALDEADQTLRWPGPQADEDDAENATDANPFDVSTQQLSDLIPDAQLELDAGDAGGFGVGDEGRSGILGIGEGAGAGGGGDFGRGFGGDGAGSAGVWRLQARGNRFVYVIDFSGSILPVERPLRTELKRSIGRLTVSQSFNVILFFGQLKGAGRGENSVARSFAPRLVEAIPENKARFFRWIETRHPHGGSDPMPAITRALAMQPDAVFLFSDGLFHDDWAALNIRRANAVNAQIHCLAFDELLLDDHSRTPRLSPGALLLRRIASQNHGKFKVVKGEDLDGRGGGR